LEEEGGDPVNTRCFVSLHEVHEERDTKRPFIGPGRPLERAQLDALIAQLAQQDHGPRDLLPERVLFFDSSMLLWWSPAQRREIYFSTADKEFNKQVIGKVVAHPTLLLKATPHMLWVWALAENARPTTQTPVMVAPYCNLYNGGSMCRGDVKLPPSIAPSTIPAWETIFYDSRFTPSNMGTKQTNHPQGHNGLWCDMLGAESFDAKYLLPTGQTVGDVLK
jgi:PRTRC genetic system protein B